MKRIFLAVTIAAFAINPGYGAFSSSDAGTSAAQFLKLGAGARAAGMGEALVAAADDSTSIYWNPAGLNKVSGKSFSLMHAVWFEDISYDWASFAMPYRDWGVFGMGVQYLSYGSIKRIDNTGLETGDFSPTDLCVSLSYARQCKGFDLGANVKYISLKIENSAVAYAADIGAQYKLMNVLDDKLTLGLAAQNMGTKVKFISEEDPLPMNIKAGGTYQIRENWIAVLDINAPIDNAVSFGIGSEYACIVNETITALGRLGYNTRNKDTGGLNGLTAGFGVAYQDYSFDYAFVPYGELGNTQRISLSVKF
ncbi:MAG: PorV/PorQ family protein [Elusimicrobiota bacterium]